MRRSTMTPTRRRVVGASGKGAEFDTGASAGPSRRVEVDRAVPRRAHHIVTVELEQHIIVKLEQDKTRVGRDMNSWRSY